MNIYPHTLLHLSKLFTVLAEGNSKTNNWSVCREETVDSQPQMDTYITPPCSWLGDYCRRVCWKIVKSRGVDDWECSGCKIAGARMNWHRLWQHARELCKLKQAEFKHGDRRWHEVSQVSEELLPIELGGWTRVHL